MSQCRVCGLETPEPVFSAKVLGRNVTYFECHLCEYVQVQAPTWLDEAYSTPINNSDTGLMVRNLANVGFVVGSLATIHKLDGRVIDSAGGYGILVRLLRDIGVDAFWTDLYCQNLVAAGFEDANGPCDLVTAFEALEHFEFPENELANFFSLSPNLLTSTSLAPIPTPPPDQWSYYGLEHGQHIGFFRLRTLQYIAKKFNKNLVSNGVNYHFFTDQPISYAKWRLFTRLATRWPRLFVRGLEPKTQSDHLKMVGR